MGTLLLQYGLPALLGFVAGVVGSLVAPWVHWAIEKRRSRMNQRREKIESWRKWAERSTLDSLMNISKMSRYREMRPHLNAEVRKELEAEVPGETLEERQKVVYGRARMLLDELTRLEKEWGLI